MVKRMASPTEEDATRIAEAINRLDIEKKIRDGQSFNKAFNDYFEDDKQIRENRGLRGMVFNEMQEIHPEITDVARERLEEGGKTVKEFPFPRLEKKRIVFTEKSMFKIRGKSVTRFRDRLGRFASN